MEAVPRMTERSFNGGTEGDSMELTKETFDDFISRLKYHHQGEGVNDHCTRDPLFIVQNRKRITGMDGSFADEYIWVNFDRDIDEADERTAKRLDALADDIFKERDLKGWEKIYYVDCWEYVSAHLTKEAAEAFIARKKHDYDQLRVYVDCQLYCWEFNAIVNGLLAGKITFTG